MGYFKTCPDCKESLEGDLIYEHFLNEYGGDEEKALETAKNYGATKTEGRWGKEIGIYDREKDRTIAFQCPFCNHRWDR
jgi:hypothetical protein